MPTSCWLLLGTPAALLWGPWCTAGLSDHQMVRETAVLSSSDITSGKFYPAWPCRVSQEPLRQQKTLGWVSPQPYSHVPREGRERIPQTTLSFHKPFIPFQKICLLRAGRRGQEQEEVAPTSAPGWALFTLPCYLLSSVSLVTIPSLRRVMTVACVCACTQVCTFMCVLECVRSLYKDT